MKTFYAVMKIQNDFLCEDDQSAKLPEGVYYIPVFEDHEVAKDHACDGKYEILELRTN